MTSLSPKRGCPPGQSVLLVATLLASVLYAVPSEAAGGLYNPPHGVRTMGRAGAAVAGQPGLNALWYNPSLIAGLPDGNHELLLDANLVIQSVEFQRAPRTFDNGRTQTFVAVENEAIPLPVPQIAYSSDFGLKEFHFALGIYGPNGANSKYPEDGPQRYTIVDTEGSLIFSQQFAVAWEPQPWLRVGAALINHTFILKRVVVLSTYPGFVGDQEDEEFDALLVTEANVPLNISGMLGAWGRIPGGIELGASFMLPTHIEDDSTVVKQRLPSHPLFDDSSVVGSTLKTSFDLPAFTRIGARYVRPTWDIELDFVYESHSSFQKIRTTPNDISVTGIPGIGTAPILELDIPRNFKDTYSLRLGGDYQFLEGELTLRAGALYESSAIPSQTLSVLQIDAEKVGLCAGITWNASRKVSLDFGYTHLFLFETEVTDSIIEQLNPTNPESNTIVANGIYRSSFDMFGVGLRLHL